MTTTQTQAHRIVVIDDNPAVHDDFRKILAPMSAARHRLEALDARLLGAKALAPAAVYRLETASQGQEGLALVQRALSDQDPFLLAFVDIRMPPGWDGVETIQHCWQAQPDLQVVICTAYSDYSWEDLRKRLGDSENLLILKKPFDNIEVLQMAKSLTKKWVATRQAETSLQVLERLVKERTQKLDEENRGRQQAEEALRTSEEMYRTVFHCSPLGLATSTLDGRFLTANPAFCALLEYSEQELQKLTVAEVSLAEEHLMVEKIKVGKSSSSDLEKRYRTKSGKVVWANFMVSIVCDTEGHPQFAISAVADITHRKKMEDALRESEAKYRRLHTSMRDAFAEVDMEGHITDCNQAYEEMTGYTVQDLRNLTYLDFTPKQWHALEAQIVVEQILVRGYSQVYTKEYRHKSGALFPVELRTFLLRNDAGQATKMWSIVRDITERKRAEESLRAASLYSRNLIETSLDPLVTISIEGKITDVNTATERVTGIGRERLIGSDFADYFTEPEMARAGYLKAFEQGQVVDYPLAINNASGAITQVLYNASVYRNEQGEVLGVFAAARDITERKRAEKTLRESEERYRTLFDRANEGIFLLSADGDLVSANESFARMHGYSVEEILRFNLKDLDTPETLKLAPERIRRLLAGESLTFEVEHYHQKGHIFPLEVSASLITSGGKSYLQCFHRDITERKRVEATLRESSFYARNLIETSLDPLVTISIEGKITDVNTATEKVTGIGRERLIGSDFADYFTEPEMARAGYLKAFEQGQVVDYPLAIRHTSGAITQVLYNASVYRNEQSEVLGVFAAARDITERKRAEKTLRESLVFRREAEKIARIGAWKVSPKTDYLHWTEGVYEILEAPLDYKPGLEEGLGFYAPESIPLLRQALTRALVDGTPFVMETLLTTMTGKKLWTEVRGLRRLDEGEQAFVIGTFQDITERKQLERQLMQAQKQEAIGQLAGGVAHDFNNILVAMMMNISFMEQNPELDAETQESLKELLAEAERAASLTRQLLMFSRKSVMEMKVVDLNKVVANLLKMLGRLIGEHVTLQFERASGLPMVEADPGMIEQVLMNLAVNARDAMPNGGRLAISLKVVPVGAEGIKGKVEVLPGTFVCLSVQDTGCGMDQATLNQIFEPFFTTKEVGKGTGLGLATVYGIAGLHKGWVEVESEVGQGTTFRVFLPQTDQRILEPTQTMKGKVVRGQETILLVEDNDAVRRMALRCLKGLGYQVLEADNGLAGLKLWQDHRGEIDLLLTDMVMPEGLTGLALAEKLKAEKPNLKVIISSGYNDDMSGQTTAQLKGTLYLQKPYEIGLLSKKIRECLDGA